MKTLTPAMDEGASANHLSGEGSATGVDAQNNVLLAAIATLNRATLNGVDLNIVDGKINFPEVSTPPLSHLMVSPTPNPTPPLVSLPTAFQWKFLVPVAARTPS